nr:hypothetical protein [Aquabacterium sp.]
MKTKITASLDRCTQSAKQTNDCECSDGRYRATGAVSAMSGEGQAMEQKCNSVDGRQDAKRYKS